MMRVSGKFTPQALTVIRISSSPGTGSDTWPTTRLSGAPMVLLSKAFTGVPPLQLTEQPHFMRLRSNVAWEVMWRHSGPFGFDFVRKSRNPHHQKFQAIPIRIGNDRK